MKRVILCALMLALSTVALAQETNSGGPKTLAATMNVYVFPTTGQTPEVQSQDEVVCYGWAVENTGTDPFELAKQAEQQKQQAQQQQEQIAQAG